MKLIRLTKTHVKYPKQPNETMMIISLKIIMMMVACSTCENEGQ